MGASLPTKRTKADVFLLLSTHASMTSMHTKTRTSFTLAHQQIFSHAKQLAFLPTQHEFIHNQQAYQDTCFSAHPPCQTTCFHASTAMIRSWSATMPNHMLLCPPTMPNHLLPCLPQQ